MTQLLTRIVPIFALFSCTVHLSAQVSNACTADYIIVGGGTAGCVLANRLQAKGTVLVLEAGLIQDNNPLISQPTAAGSLVLNYTNDFFWPLGHARVDTAPDNKRFPAVAGEILGGGSSVNGLQYVRGSSSFFADWQTISGDADWGPVNATNVYKAMENFNGVPGQFNPAIHGTGGPVDIRQAALNVQAATVFQAAVASLGYPAITDYNDPATPIGPFLYWQLFEQPSGIRESSSTAYLQGTLVQKDSNVYVSTNNRLTVYTQSHVTKVLFSTAAGATQPRATGVHAIVSGDEKVFFARKKVILCTGFQSPLLLQASGIGNPTLLNSLNIPVVVSNSNVGQNMENHPIIALTGLGTVPAPIAPDFNGLYSGGAELPDPSVSGTTRALQMIGIATPPSAFTIATLLLKAQSLGSVNLLYPDPLRMPIYDFNYFTNPADIATGVAAYTLMYNTLVAMGLTPQGPDPVTQPAQVITYVTTTYTQAYHWTGACKMTQSPATGVVDSTGHVYGVSDLIVADITIIPTSPTGNCAAPAFLVGNVIANKLLAA